MSSAEPPRERVIEAGRGWAAADLRELWEFRELLLLLAWRDVKVKYKQTALGAVWVILQPLTAMAIFSVLFGRLAKVPSDGLPYPLFVLAGLLPWNYFAGALNSTSGSLIASANLVTKVYFPRVIIPASASVSGLIDLAIASFLLLGLLLHYRLRPDPGGLVLLPLLALMIFLFATGCGLWLSALNVEYRDFQYVVPFLVQTWIFLTPVIYPVTFLPERYRWLLSLNPMAGFIETFRSALFGHRPPDWRFLGVSAAVAAAVLLSGLAYFRKVERSFADVI